VKLFSPLLLLSAVNANDLDAIASHIVWHSPSVIINS